MINKYLTEDGLLKSWPSKKSVKVEVLKYIISKFEVGRYYSEIEVNNILIRWHSFNDHALLRRELYENNLLTRSKDCKQYWVSEDESL